MEQDLSSQEKQDNSLPELKPQTLFTKPTVVNYEQYRIQDTDQTDIDYKQYINDPKLTLEFIEEEPGEPKFYKKPSAKSTTVDWRRMESCNAKEKKSSTT